MPDQDNPLLEADRLEVRAMIGEAMNRPRVRGKHFEGDSLCPESWEANQVSGGAMKSLTTLERETLTYLAEGLILKEIAFKRGRSEQTLKLQMMTIRKKLYAETTAHAVAIFVRLS